MKNNLGQLLGFVIFVVGVCSCVSGVEGNITPSETNVTATTKPLVTSVPTAAPTPISNLADNLREHQTPEPKLASSSCRLDSSLSALTPGVTELTIKQEFEGETIDRRYLVHTPNEIDGTRCYPLLFALHGIGGVPDRYPKKFSQFVENHEFIGI